MVRLPRFSLPGLPQHVIQRGNNKTPMFLRPDDYGFFRDCLESAARRFDCDVHAYVFMTNHVHLLMSPAAAGGISRTMQSIGSKYVHRFNRTYDRTGTLWEGRYRATLIDSERYLFTCNRYIELNPLRAGLSRSPGDYPWSSYHANALGYADSLVTPHAEYLALGSLPPERQAAYRALFCDALESAAVHAICDATNKGWALGSERFCRRVTQLGRRAVPIALGRPPANQE